ncbi:MAG: hypothetical protein COW85_04500 [Ignavibacteria bacterium CG22_combo_CG10-13_8_21_14_all_37_15]|nr:glycosyltransferase family 2 protein [Ignavibacteria bacterium]PIP78396.1 MAG: hypothetical protein COW85_04500 [Ignavibacteria bacterium CG22_combo_CG10-13_8_21_14_all_37_15]
MSADILPNKKIDLSIIIINYNLAKEITNCLNSLFHEIDKLKHFDYEVIIIDNNSPDNGLPATEKKFLKDNIHFYYLKENIGFGKGCNYGTSKASGEYLCFLNPDTIITEDIFTPIISLFKSDESIGIIGPKQQVSPPFFDFSAGFSPNIFFELFNLFGIGVFIEGFIISLYAKIKTEKKIEVNWILGAAIFIRFELFKTINGFDKDYFMFSEEVDLCKRVSDYGLKIIYYPDLAIHHIGSVSGKKDYTLYTIRTYSSKFLYISKHFEGPNGALMRFLVQLQLLSQIFIWVVLFPVNEQKSKQKLNAFIHLLKARGKYEHRH